ncbi:acetamidase/formamidase family protein [Dactylosporangium roseum]|uniref:Acetamidase/formamidase family protein n=1 Tax=Dactylosporangium roseum TaxID=47989 RepID=A0ABY5ZB33_9ACTN|nr:acetamidase/formamidase family protein [Dactylosporangium roseum]UWZ39249.1 acetamidase/formamidase family protein [Dactylosporangium roseum]
MAEHLMDPSIVHHQWDATLPAALTINSGDIVHFDLRMAGHQQIRHGQPFSTTHLDPATLYHLQGPIHVAGARAGDTLAIDVLELKPGSWGWCGVLPGLGLLPEFADKPFLRYFDLTAPTTEIAAGVHIPIRPFLGVMATLERTITNASPFPPHQGGGNIDTRHLVVGSTLRLPVLRDGAIFSCGDPHAAQGDGEVCVNALETDMTATLRFTLSNRTISAPRFTVPAQPLTADGTDGHYGTMGIDTDLMEGARKATRAMIEILADEHDLPAEDAYLVCSLAGDLRIFEIVDAGVWNVGMTMPHSIFSGR